LCVCLCARLCSCFLRVCVHARVLVCALLRVCVHVFVCFRVCARVCARMCVRVRVCLCSCAGVFVCFCVHVCSCVCVRVCACVCVCVHVASWVCAHARTEGECLCTHVRARKDRRAQGRGSESFQGEARRASRERLGQLPGRGDSAQRALRGEAQRANNQKRMRDGRRCRQPRSSLQRGLKEDLKAIHVVRERRTTKIFVPLYHEDLQGTKIFIKPRSQRFTWHDLRGAIYRGTGSSCASRKSLSILSLLWMRDGHRRRQPCSPLLQCATAAAAASGGEDGGGPARPTFSLELF
jgi:hypothetical protein